MTFKPDYVFALNDLQIQRHFPNLIKGNNFAFTSEQTEDYNCIAWITEVIDDWKQLYEENGNVIRNSENYISYFRDLGFEITDKLDLEDNTLKIVIYIESNSNHFKHVARQLNTGKWTSKLGDWEDIQHDTPNDLVGQSYGDKLVIMSRKINT